MDEKWERIVLVYQIDENMGFVCYDVGWKCEGWLVNV